MNNSNDARELTLALGGRWYGRYGTCACLVCQPDRQRDQNALTLADGAAGLLAHCKKGCAFRDILAAAGVLPGDYSPPDPIVAAQRDADQRREVEKRERQARAIWAEALPIAGTTAERYLRECRGITAPLPVSLRFHPEAWHGPSARRLPAMIARVDGADGAAIHRTFLRPDGQGKAVVAPAGTEKMMLGATAGGAVRLAEALGPLVVAEGIETALALASGILRRPATIWAALSASGMKSLHLPAEPGRLTIATDGDRAGREAGHALATRADALGWTVSLLPAPDGRDWADVLAQKGAVA